MDVDTSKLSATCAFCDSPLEVSTAEEAEPVDAVAPFQLTQEQASQRLRTHLSSQWLAPSALQKLARPGELNAVLVPFYRYDATVRTQFSCSVGCYWYRTETYTTTVNGKTVVRTRQVRETEWSPLSGTHGRTWIDHLVSASKGLPESEANQLEPFDVGAALPFAPSLVAGIIAERPTIGHTEARATANNELSALEKREIAGAHLPGDTHSGLKTSSQVQVDAVRLVLLPVWVAAYPLGKGKALRLLVNGQTGEVVGKIPRSTTKVVLLVLAIITAIVAVVGGFLVCGGLTSALGSM
ncbi:MAG: hypothetical protein KC912_12510 [Proteobacteria bacterium]|nr:hypothetical protein [Pseudomonadota bacterium]